LKFSNFQIANFQIIIPMKTKLLHSTVLYLIRKCRRPVVYRLLLILALSPLLCALRPAFAQIPQGFNYQAIARDGSGNPMAGQSLQVEISIQSDTSAAPNVIWNEQFNPVKTNAFGLFTVVIGKGVRQSGTALFFDSIQWAAAPAFIKTQIYYGGSWKYMGQSKLWSVPYAMVSGDLAGPVKKLAVTGVATSPDSALFEVKNKNGQTVFAVYNEGVRVYVSDGIAKGATKGGFAIGGFSSAKAPSQEYFVVNSDSIRAYIDTNTVKARKGGFAIGGFDKAKAGNEEYLRVTRDSTRIYIKESAKGIKGGFAIGGFDRAKGTITPFTSLTPDNYFIGHRSGAANTSGLYNSFLGFETGPVNKAGSNNAFFGYQAGFKNDGGASNLFLGYQSGYSNIVGNYNSFMGYQAGYNNSSGEKNSFIGSYAGSGNSTGGNNSFLGYSAGFSNVEGSYNNFIGTLSGYSNIGGSNNVFLGPESGYLNSSGNYNTFIGHKAGYSNSASYNVFLGFESGFSNTTGSPNVFIGYQAGRANAGGTNNIFLGNQAGLLNTSGYDNVYIGNSVGRNGTGAYSNVFIGNMCGNEITNGLRDVYIGNLAGRKTTIGDGNVFIGHAAGELNTTGYGNIMIGSYAGQNSNGLGNVILGLQAGISNSSGNYNVFLGSNSGRNNTTGSMNILIGTQAGYSNSTGGGNIFIGHYAGFNELGSNKLYIDNTSLSTPLIYGDFNADYVKINGAFDVSGSANINNTWVFAQGLELNAGGTGNRDSYIDFHSDNGFTDFALRMIRTPGADGPASITQRGLGSLTLITAEAAPIILATGSSEKFRVDPNGNVGINHSAPGQKLDIWAGNGRVQTGYSWLTNSDIRYKKNITELEGSLDKVLRIRGVRFDLTEEKNVTEGQGRYIGFIAQELEQEFPEFVVTEENGYKSVAYDKMCAVLVEAVKDQQKLIDNQQQQIDSAIQENKQLKSDFQSLRDEMDQIKTIIARGGVK
jgi:hypothetical protein